MELSLFSSPPSTPPGNIDNQQLQQPWWLWKPAAEQTREEVEIVVLWKAPSPENCHYFLSLAASWERPIHKVSASLIHLRTHRGGGGGEALSKARTLKKKKKKRSPWQLVNTTAAWKGNTSWSEQETDQKPERKIWGMKWSSGPLKSSDIIVGI